MKYRITTIIIGLVSVFFLFIIPANKYEWMYEEGMHKLPYDENFAMYRGLSMFPILLFLVLIFFNKNIKEKWTFGLVFTVILFFWFLKFWI